MQTYVWYGDAVLPFDRYRKFWTSEGFHDWSRYGFGRNRALFKSIWIPKSIFKNWRSTKFPGKIVPVVGKNARKISYCGTFADPRNFRRFAELLPIRGTFASFLGNCGGTKKFRAELYRGYGELPGKVVPDKIFKIG
jgi:hypothetical protein